MTSLPESENIDCINELKNEIKMLTRNQKILEHDYIALLDEYKEEKESYFNELNLLYENVYSETKKLIDELVPIKSQYNIYTLNMGDKLGNFVVTHYKAINNELGKIVEYEIECEGREIIEGNLYYNYRYKGDTVLKISKKDIYRIPHSSCYEVIDIDNAEQLKKIIGKNYHQGMKVTMEVSEYNCYYEDYSEVYESISFDKVLTFN
jgi:hypothetical protein